MYWVASLACQPMARRGRRSAAASSVCSTEAEAEPVRFLLWECGWGAEACFRSSQGVVRVCV